ncbi:MAG TPA: glycosyltransferase family 4 protein, partial [Candidatus Krumholzibacterium sp.]|nr:glycosyltransferase family 4 protein [Candidatus Krumholzibacterium sp.]
MKIVIALPSSPWPVERGTGRLIMSLVRGLAERHRVVLVTMTQSGRESERLREIETDSIKVVPMIAPNKRSLAAKIWYRLKHQMLQSFFSIPLETSYSAPGRFLETVASVARKEKADLVLANYWHLYRLPDLLGAIPSALITHDIDYLIERPVSTTLDRKKCGGKVRPELEERIEKAAYRKYGRILTVTSHDASRLAGEMPEKAGCIETLPLALDLDMFAASGRTRENGPVLFTGTFSSDFNIDALTYLVDEVVPVLLRIRPDIRIRIAGGGVPGDIAARAPGCVEFAGYVEDLAVELDGASLMVLPLRFAGGVRIRMLEAAAMSLPVVSTSAGVGGMGLEDGKEFLLADTAAEMAEKIVEVLEDGDLASSLGVSARKWVERN